MARKSQPRVVHIECATPTMYRWFCCKVTPHAATRVQDGFRILDEDRFAAILRAAEGREIGGAS